MVAACRGRLLEERSIDGDEKRSSDRLARRRAARSVTVNVAESPLGWLFSRGLVTQAQFDAGERLRLDWERAQLAPHVTMHWDAGPIGSRSAGAPGGPDLTAPAIDARRRFEAAIAAAGPGLADILWRVVCAGDGMREAETALGWPARAGKLVLTLALDRVAAFYRIG